MPFLNQRKGENDRRKYFMINLHERMLPTSAGVEPATSWSPVGRRIQLSHRGRLGKDIYIYAEAVLASTHNLCFEQKYEKCQIFFSEKFHFLVVKFSVHLNRRVFVMIFIFFLHMIDTNMI